MKSEKGSPRKKLNATNLTSNEATHRKEQYAKKKHLDKFESILQLYKTKSTGYYQTAKCVIAPEIMECTAKKFGTYCFSPF